MVGRDIVGSGLTVDLIKRTVRWLSSLRDTMWSKAGVIYHVPTPGVTGTDMSRRYYNERHINGRPMQCGVLAEHFQLLVEELLINLACFSLLLTSFQPAQLMAAVDRLETDSA